MYSSSFSNPTSCESSTSAATKAEKKKKKGGGGNTVKLSTDPQSVAARQRRHRISDRFKILQSLVPGGAKMDTVSMLEEAIQYVKFLKTQIWFHQAVIGYVDHHNTNADAINPSCSNFPTNNFSNVPFHDHHQRQVDSSNNCNYPLGQALQGESTQLGLPYSWFPQGDEEKYGHFDGSTHKY